MPGLSKSDLLVESERSLRLYRTETGYVLVRPWRGWRHAVAAGAGGFLCYLAIESIRTGAAIPWPKEPPAWMVLGLGAVARAVAARPSRSTSSRASSAAGAR